MLQLETCNPYCSVLLTAIVGRQAEDVDYHVPLAHAVHTQHDPGEPELLPGNTPCRLQRF